MTNDVVLETFNALLIAGIIVYQLFILRKTGLKGKPGTKLILAGFCFMLIGACLDITDEFDQLNQYVVIGDTKVEAFLEKFFGYMLGSVLLLVGFTRMLPMFEQLSVKQKLIETIIETSPVPTFCKDNEGRYLECNSAFEAFIGYSRAQIIGQTAYAVAPADLAEIYHQADQKLIQQMGRQVYEAEVEGADGDSRHVLFHKATFSNEEGTAGGLVGVMLDITDRKKVEEGLRKIGQMKSDFISVAAHELRTPLTSIQGYTELLISAQESGFFNTEQQLDFEREIMQASDSLCRLIDDLLDVGRIERGLPLALDSRMTDPRPIFAKSLAAFRMKFAQRDFLLEGELPVSFEIACDPQRLRQVVENLLSNAVKYSEESEPIELTLSATSDGFRFEIRDFGIGMSAEQQALAFDKFYRGIEDQSGISGMGIGLSIVKNIVAAHHGQAQIESQLTKGTSVRVDLPLTQPV